MGETGNTANPLHVLQTYISKDSHGHNPHGVDETCVRLRYANRTYTGSLIAVVQWSTFYLRFACKWENF